MNPDFCNAPQLFTIAVPSQSSSSTTATDNVSPLVCTSPLRPIKFGCLSSISRSAVCVVSPSNRITSIQSVSYSRIRISLSSGDSFLLYYWSQLYCFDTIRRWCVCAVPSLLCGHSSLARDKLLQHSSIATSISDVLSSNTIAVNRQQSRLGRWTDDTWWKFEACDLDTMNKRGNTAQCVCSSPSNLHHINIIKIQLLRSSLPVFDRRLLLGHSHISLIAIVLLWHNTSLVCMCCAFAAVW
jgi:hypothetical protein